MYYIKKDNKYLTKEGTWTESILQANPYNTEEEAKEDLNDYGGELYKTPVNLD